MCRQTDGFQSSIAIVAKSGTSRHRSPPAGKCPMAATKELLLGRIHGHPPRAKLFVFCGRGGMGETPQRQCNGTAMRRWQPASRTGDAKPVIKSSLTTTPDDIMKLTQTAPAVRWLILLNTSPTSNRVMPLRTERRSCRAGPRGQTARGLASAEQNMRESPQEGISAMILIAELQRVPIT
jgi:hypothetical protein